VEGAVPPPQPHPSPNPIPFGACSASPHICQPPSYFFTILTLNAQTVATQLGLCIGAFIVISFRWDSVTLDYRKKVIDRELKPYCNCT